MQRSLEKQLVQWFLDAYNHAHKENFRISSWPEDEDRNRPAVEALAENGRLSMAIEHTLVQPFQGERSDNAIFNRAIAPLESDPTLIRPNLDVTITTEVGAVPKGANLIQVAKEIRDWLTANIEAIPEGISRHRVPNLPFSLEIVVEKVLDDTPGFPGSLFVMRSRPQDTFNLVLQKALDSKLPKLVSTRADLKVLLLERSDVLGGHFRFSAAIEEFFNGKNARLRPDEIWLVNTVGLKKYGALSFFDVWPDYRKHVLFAKAQDGKITLSSAS